ncbi:MAG: recombination-associated protein RdgC [Leptothrix sp. (in: b-proteobacteria)]
MFKNLLVFRLAASWQPDFAALEAALDVTPFHPCGASQPMSAGWVSPRGSAHAALAESIGGHWLVKLKIEQKVLPGAVVKRRIDAMADQIEQQTGRKPGKKQRKELKDQATLELLPQAFTKEMSLPVWLAPEQRLLMLDTSSAAKADEVITLLTKALPGFAVEPLHTALSPAAAMSGWLLGAPRSPQAAPAPQGGESILGRPGDRLGAPHEGADEAAAGFDIPHAFSIDRECELKSADEMKSVVRYARHALDTDEVRAHIGLGKRPTRLALTWQGRVSFMLTEALQIKKLDFLDGVYEGQPPASRDEGEAFDTNAAIATGELIRLIPDLIDALGGEQLPGQVADTLAPPSPPQSQPQSQPRSPAVSRPAARAATAPAAPVSALSQAPVSDDTPPWE